jgi:TnpA family transposase
MAIKAVEMVRKIRNKHYEDIKSLSMTNQIRFYKQKSEKLQKILKKFERAPVQHTTKRAISQTR